MSQHHITLDFEDEETLHAALEYLGDADAPVMITSGRVESDDQSFQLWDDFDAAMAATGPDSEPKP